MLLAEEETFLIAPDEQRIHIEQLILWTLTTDTAAK
jgi:hypothetical protein